ncbi:hypothetical protein, partial [Limosilactobacillus mucosae]|uniref:hypothetical protein n=1 Tax=Limosilactobacillus mucosae TaxID=97478 RepID=UPI0022E875DB
IYANCGSDTQYWGVCPQAIDFSRWWLTYTGDHQWGRIQQHLCAQLQLKMSLDAAVFSLMRTVWNRFCKI